MSFGDGPRVVLGSITSPARCFEYHDGITTEIGRRRFQQWAQCNFDLIKFWSDFLSVYWFPPNAQTFVSIGTVLVSKIRNQYFRSYCEVSGNSKDLNVVRPSGLSVPIEFPRRFISVNLQNCTYEFPRKCII